MSFFKQHKRSMFGEMLYIYRRSRELYTQLALQEFLNEKGFYVPPTMISKYESAVGRTPKAEFIYHVVLHLRLNHNEEEALIDAYFLDLKLKFFDEYKSWHTDKNKAKRKKQ